jgi:hypothetical protein
MEAGGDVPGCGDAAVFDAEAFFERDEKPDSDEEV